MVPIDDVASVGTGDLGPVVPGKEIRIVDSDDRDVPDGIVGTGSGWSVVSRT
jgi:non-ribosomal peptide synthetase component E (peptide arylation enzyme)